MDKGIMGKEKKKRLGKKYLDNPSQTTSVFDTKHPLLKTSLHPAHREAFICLFSKITRWNGETQCSYTYCPRGTDHLQRLRIVRGPRAVAGYLYDELTRAANKHAVQL